MKPGIQNYEERPQVSLASALGGLARLDRVWLTSVILVVGLTLFDPPQAPKSLDFLLDSLLWIAPFLAIAVLVAAYARASGADGLTARVFSGRPETMILAAALFGALSPFCSCGVIPLIAALLAAGAPLPAVMAFWLASPIMDPEVFVLTAAGLGSGFAIAKTLAAVALGLAGGFITMALQGRSQAFAQPLKRAPSGCAAKGLNEGKVVWAFWKESSRRQHFGQEATSNGLFLLKWMALAFLLESLMLTYVPAADMIALVGEEQSFAIPLAALVGVPAYLNSYAAIPTTSALMDLGMTSGAAMAFMVAGAVTSIPAAIAVYALVRRPIFLTYLAFALIGAMLTGWVYQLALNLW
ncbi:MAG: permease [Kiloniellales bacterium]